MLPNSEDRHPHKTLLATSTSPISPMSIGSWLLVFFNLVAFVNCYAWLTERQRNNLFAMLPQRLKFLGRLNYDLDRWRNSLAIIGLPISVGVGVYTGVLLFGAVQSRPFWNTNLVAQLFLFSGLSTACAALILGLAGRNESAEELRLLHRLETCICPSGISERKQIFSVICKAGSVDQRQLSAPTWPTKSPRYSARSEPG